GGSRPSSRANEDPVSMPGRYAPEPGRVTLVIHHFGTAAAVFFFAGLNCRSWLGAWPSRATNGAKSRGRGSPRLPPPVSVAVLRAPRRYSVCRQSISDSWLLNLRECLAHLG